MPRDPAGKGASEPWWRENATLVAVVGLVVTMIFNTIGVWLQVGQARVASKQAELAAQAASRARVDTQLGLVTQLNSLAADADRDVVAAGIQDTRCQVGHVWTPKERAVVNRAAQYYDFLAWLFQQRAIVLDAARRYTAPAMLAMFELSRDVFGPTGVERTYPELMSFAIANASGPPDDPCA